VPGSLFDIVSLVPALRVVFFDFDPSHLEAPRPNKMPRDNWEFHNIESR
jgi:hypothetical protein